MGIFLYAGAIPLKCSSMVDPRCQVELMSGRKSGPVLHFSISKSVNIAQKGHFLDVGILKSVNEVART